jgi:integrase
MEMRRKRGAGTVVRMHGSYYARWRVAKEDVYGEPRRARDEAEADRLAGGPFLAAATAPRKREIPLFQVWAHEQMQGRYGAHLADTTLNTNETLRNCYIEGKPIGKLRLDRISSKVAQEFADEIKGSPAYVRRIVAFCSKLFSLAVKEGWVKANPFKGLELPEVQERDNRILAPDEAIKLLDPQTRTDAIMLVALHTGMRKSEILRLQWSHVSPEAIKVPGTKNRHSRAIVPNTPEAMAAIAAQPKRSIFIFSTAEGKALGARYVARAFAARRKQLGLPPETRLQDLRGTYGSLMLEAGADLKTVQVLMRHADPRTTIKMYLRSRQETQIAAVELLRLKTGVKPARSAQKGRKHA